MGKNITKLGKTSDEYEKLIRTQANTFDNKTPNQKKSSRLEWSESSWLRFLNILFWRWVNPLLSIGSKQSLTEVDLDDIPNVDKSMILLQRIQLYNFHQISIWKILFKEFWKDYLLAGIFFLPYSLTRIAQPLIIRQILLILSDSTYSPFWHVYLYATLYMFCGICTALFSRQNIFRSLRIGVRIRNALITYLYVQSLVMKLPVALQISTGQIINIISNDARKFEDVFAYLHYLWLGTFDIIVIFSLLAWIIKPLPALFGFIVLILFFCLQLFINRKYHEYRQIIARCCDKRLEAFHEFLYGYLNIKMSNWEKIVERQLLKFRQNESRSLHHSFYVRTFVMSLPLILIPLVSFVILTGSWLLGYSLNLINTFTALSLLVQMRSTVCNFLTTAIDRINDVRTASQRITSFLRSIRARDKEINTIFYRRGRYKDEKGSIQMSNASFGWNDNMICLRSLNLNIPSGSFVGILGEVGSGKSSFLSALLGEMNLLHGDFSTNNSSFSYVSQSPWIFADTFRNNILLDQIYDKEKYEKILYACCLNVDISLFGSRGDLIMIGERGVNLSGGQKARVSLARALYADADIYLIDDPLASVDRLVAKQIYDRCLGSNSLLRNKTRLLVTHQTEYVRDVDQTIYFSNGQITQEMQSNETNLRTNLDLNDELIQENIISNEQSSLLDIQTMLNEEKIVDTKNHWSIWYRLFTASPFGKLRLVLLILFLVIGQIFYDGTNLWLSQQLRTSNLNRQYAPKFPLFYSLLTFAIIVFNLIRFYYFFHVYLRGCDYFHNQMSKGLIYTSINFFQTNPSGRILNRLSKDQEVLDEILSGILLDGLIALLILLGSITITCIINPWILIILAILIPILFFLTRYYLLTNRQLKKIESRTRSPIYDLFTSSLQGLATIRAFRIQKCFLHLLTDRIDLNTSAYLNMKGASHWFATRLQCCASLTVFSIVILLILLRNYIPLSLITLALMYTISQSFWLHWTIAQLAEADILMTSAERIDEYGQLKPEEDYGGQQKLLMIPTTWPSNGTIAFVNYSLSYRSNHEMILKDINLKIESGEKIGIIGRTGAGKSSLFKGIFRCIHRSNIQGKILIDNIDISRITLSQLRHHLSIIPQDPILFRGTLRYNIDPLNQYSDDQCWMALEDVQLKPFVISHPASLRMMISQLGTNLSVGQAQLICIARAILKKTKILLIDEATANIDEKTDEIIQEIIQEKFRDRTVLIIAHRLNTVAKCDKILVLDRGAIKDFDVPEKIFGNY